MKLRLDTLFVRLATMTVGLIVLLHITFLLLVDRERALLEVQHISEAVMTAVVVRAYDAQLVPVVSAELGIEYVPEQAERHSSCSAGGCGSSLHPIAHALSERLPPGSRVQIQKDGMISVGVDGTGYTITLPHAFLPAGRFMSASLLMIVCAVMSALAFAWQIQRPVRALAQATRRFRVGEAFRDLRLSGPIEIRELTANFNEMANALSEAERERVVMLAGLAHDLRAPITRMQVRAELLDDDLDRTAFLHDAESMSRIVDQFLDFTRDTVRPSPEAGVDEICRREYGALNAGAALAGDVAQERVVLDLRAGVDFRLPGLELERILANVVQNAMTHGASPVEITTRKVHDGFLLRIVDHGQGVPEDELALIQLPFVRLDPARGAHAGCGLGLAIVRRLVRSLGGTLAITNVRGGGLAVTMTFKPRRAQKRIDTETRQAI